MTDDQKFALAVLSAGDNSAHHPFQRDRMSGATIRKMGETVDLDIVRRVRTRLELDRTVVLRGDR